MEDYVFKTDPFDHQRERFKLYRDKIYHAHEWEQGTGKTKLIIDTACYLYGKGLIDALFVVSKNGVHRNWIRIEVPKHCPDYVDVMSAYYASTMKASERKHLEKTLRHSGLIVVAQNVEALSTKKGASFLKDFLLTNRTMLVVDDADIKSIDALRTKALVDLSIHAKYRRVLDGTPITQGPMDAFAPYLFLDETILGTSSYYAFRTQYAIMKTIEVEDKRFPGNMEKRRKVKIIDSYRNLDKLKALLDPHRDRVLKSECLDLPDKLFQKRFVELSAKQRTIYDAMKNDLVAEHEGKVMSVGLALTKLMRLQQVTGGFFVEDDVPEYDEFDMPIISKGKAPVSIDGDKNKRVECLMEIAEETTGKMIIWARYRAEIAVIADALRKKYGKKSVVEYHGGISDDDRADNIDKFQDLDDPATYFIGHVQAGGKGLTLHAASTVVYFSNDFSLMNRLQSEDRAHRIGQEKNVLYIDIIAVNTLDEHIVDVLRNKKNVADLLNGDTPLRSWL